MSLGNILASWILYFTITRNEAVSPPRHHYKRRGRDGERGVWGEKERETAAPPRCSAPPAGDRDRGDRGGGGREDSVFRASLPFRVSLSAASRVMNTKQKVPRGRRTQIRASAAAAALRSALTPPGSSIENNCEMRVFLLSGEEEQIELKHQRRWSPHSIFISTSWIHTQGFLFCSTQYLCNKH